MDKIYSKKIYSISKKEIKGIISERSFLLTVFIQFFIASFSVFLIFGLTTFYDPGALQDLNLDQSNIGIIGNDEGELYELLEASDLNIEVYGDFTDAYTAFYERKIDAIIRIPHEPPDGEGLIDIDIYLSRSELSATIVSIKLKEPLEEFEQSVRDIRTSRLPDYTPMELNIDKPDGGPSIINLEFIYVALLPILLLTPAFISGGLIIDFITEEFENRTIDLLMASPVSFLDILGGKVIVATLIVPIQSLAWMILLSLNGIQINNFMIILVLISIVALILVTLGGIISVSVKERGLSQMFYSFTLILLFMTSYLYMNSPLNMISRLSIGSISTVESLIWIGFYSTVSVVMLWLLIKRAEKDVFN